MAKEYGLKERYAEGLSNALKEIEMHGMDFWNDEMKTRRVKITITMETDCIVTVRYEKETVPVPFVAIVSEDER